MRIEASNLVSTGAIGSDFTVNQNSVPLWMGHVNQVSITFRNINATGSLKLQGSNDSNTQENSSKVSVNEWVDITGATLALAGTGIGYMEKVDLTFRWIRVVFTFTSGAGVLNSALMATKGF